MKNVYPLIVAFQHFAGKPLKVLDAVEAIDVEVLNTCQNMLLEIARNLRREDQNEWPDCHKLANQIEEALQ